MARAVGGIAATSAAVRCDAGGSHRGIVKSATARATAVPASAFHPVASPSRVRARAAASANAGISGSTYCGSLDWFSMKKTSGPSTQEARRIGSRAARFTRRACHAHFTRPPPSRASTGTIHGKAATGRIGR